MLLKPCSCRPLFFVVCAAAAAAPAVAYVAVAVAVAYVAIATAAVVLLATVSLWQPLLHSRKIKKICNGLHSKLFN